MLLDNLKSQPFLCVLFNFMLFWIFCLQKHLVETKEPSRTVPAPPENLWLINEFIWETKLLWLINEFTWETKLNRFIQEAYRLETTGEAGEYRTDMHGNWWALGYFYARKHELLFPYIFFAPSSR